MRQIFLAFTCLSTFALMQNVLSVSAQSARAGEFVSSSTEAPGFSAVGHASSERPPTHSTALLFAGLAGLTFAGGRRPEAEPTPA